MSPLLPTTRYFTPPDGGQMVMPALTRSNGEDSVNHHERTQLVKRPHPDICAGANY